MSQRAGIPILISCVTSGESVGLAELHFSTLANTCLQDCSRSRRADVLGAPSVSNTQCRRQHCCCVVELVEGLVWRTDPGFHLEQVRAKCQLRALLVLSAPSLPGHPRGVNRSAPLLLCYLGISWADALLFSTGSRKSFKTLLHSDSQGWPDLS